MFCTNKNSKTPTFECYLNAPVGGRQGAVQTDTSMVASKQIDLNISTNLKSGFRSPEEHPLPITALRENERLKSHVKYLTFSEGETLLKDHLFYFFCSHSFHGPRDLTAFSEVKVKQKYY